MRTILITLWLLVLAACGSDTTEDYLARAREYLAANDQAAATIELQNALQLDGKSAEAIFEFAQDTHARNLPDREDGGQNQTCLY